MFTLLLVLLFIPFIGAFVTAPLQQRKADVAAVIMAGAVMLAAISAIIWAGGGRFDYSLAGLPWLTVPFPLFGIQVDPLSSLMLLAITVVGFLIVLYSAGYMSELNKEHPTQAEKDRYYFFTLLFVGAMTGLVLSRNFFQIFLFWELTTLCSWGLISHKRSSVAVQAGFKAMVITAGAGLFFIAALLIMYVKTGSFEFSALGQLPPTLRLTAVIFLLIGAWGKSAQLPFSSWLPTAMEAPTPASAYLHAAAMVKAGVYLTARTIISSQAVPAQAGYLMGGLAVATMFFGLILYFFQDDLKRLLAFSTIAHLGYMFLGMSLGVAGSRLALQGGLLHLINHAFTKTLLFLAVGAISCATGTRSIKALSGLGRKMPVTAAAFIIGALSISGVPPFNIFWSKFFIIAGAIQLNSAWGWTVGLLAIVESLAGFAWFLAVVHRVFFGPASPAAAAAADPPPVMLIPLLVLMVLSLLSPVFGLAIITRIMGG
ncbi:hydrogenase 4 subunit D [Pelotomaculum propionicicum]|uniref:Na(+)/H(+) antiporter subunit A n=1 Tax=Pelotomaculum propionicicum TaxID=258475 RepID=A0A4Y7RSW1_9FIRM|nr:hydrogenase 4 subunit D [Pelotomaculum propionicicum]TEB11819.1 Na(+)/H(+) antiporter subunit A [Pelotomaculum propionicicum]